MRAQDEKEDLLYCPWRARWDICVPTHTAEPIDGWKGWLLLGGRQRTATTRCLVFFLWGEATSQQWRRA